MKDTIVKVAGFKAAAIAAAVKQKNRLDVGLILSDSAASAAGLFTTNRVKASCVLLAQRRLSRGAAQAVIVNSGNANACVGPSGMRHTVLITDALAQNLKIDSSLCLMNSTGVIGTPLPGDKIRAAVPALIAKANPDGFADFSRAIMTTDTYPKTALRKVKIGGKTVTLGGVAKGSGMINPNMATLLAYVVTDAVIAPAALREVLAAAAEDSLNAVTVDGDMSTNDSLIALAGGASGVQVDANAADRKAFQEAMADLCLELARDVARDGEGATKMFTVIVEGARSRREADAVARKVANSPLVKTAFHAGDPNWGRIMAALGGTGAKFGVDKVSLRFETPEGKHINVVKGYDAAPDYNEAEAKKILSSKEFIVRIDLARGKGSRAIMSCDLSVAYIKINADYRT